MDVSMISRLKELETENINLNKIGLLKGILQKNGKNICAVVSLE